ncbi:MULTISPECIES: hypothetical protein [unclassified Methylobacterium]|uniref:hypothetical protein n=1 Tax=unclassified Methylobacterium TaxID=2615210 RepID=UPI0011C1F8FF|nr:MULTISPECIES: hypothetical protein [unclassified Methylobacterium]QEE38836.1 hypothetical protein FVA80_07525 [Methylobacterium sp. WL1]TXN53822.1 hypothetical protein FV241_26675 [Methylobacterium sp. WL2]
MSDDDEVPDDDQTPAINAVISLIHNAAAPLQDVAALPLIASARPDAMAVWAIGYGEVLTVAQTRTLASAFDLFALAVRPAATRTLQ